MQRIMNMLYMLTPKGDSCGMEMIDRAIDTYLQMSSEYYGELLRQMPEKQRNVFLAIAAEGQVKTISGGKFVQKQAPDFGGLPYEAILLYFTSCPLVRYFTPFFTITMRPFSKRLPSFNALSPGMTISMPVGTV